MVLKQFILSPDFSKIPNGYVANIYWIGIMQKAEGTYVEVTGVVAIF